MKIFTILLWPFTTLITKVFEFSFFLTGNYGISLILVSFFITLITAPLYILADKWKAEELTLKNKMAQSLQSINTHYTGSKKFYLTKTLQKVWGYTGLHSFKTSFGLILQIPFFFGAYEALTHYSGYQGVVFLFLQDLSKADSLFFGLALMPFIMTLVNILSAAYYNRSFSWHKNKSLYIMAGVFLVLLYKSPSALLVYWTMNNVFSILKTFVLKKLGLSVGTVEAVQVRKEKSLYQTVKLYLKENPNLFLYFFFIITLSLVVFLSFSKEQKNIFYRILIVFLICTSLVQVIISIRKKEYTTTILFVLFGLIPFLSLLAFFFGNKYKFISKTNLKTLIGLSLVFLQFLKPFYKIYKDRKYKPTTKRDKRHFLYYVVFLSVFVLYNSFLIYFSDPVSIGVLLSELLFTALKLFIVVAGILFCIYKLSQKKLELINKLLLFIILLSLSYNYLLRLDLGIIDVLTIQNQDILQNMPFIFYLLDPLVFVCLIILTKILYTKKNTAPFFAFLSIVLIFHLSFKIPTLQNKTSSIAQDFVLPQNASLNHRFSRAGNNVVFIVADMFNGNYINRLIEESPKYKEDLRGFVYYPDCLSVSPSTASSLPAIYGGYDYLPHKLHNNQLTGRDEIQKSFSFFFDQLTPQYRSTISDPEYLYLESSTRYNIENSADYVSYWSKKNAIPLLKANYKFLPFIVALFNASPWFLKNSIYDDSSWLLYANIFSNVRKTTIEELAYLDLLPEIASITENDTGLFLFHHNLIPHVYYGIDKHGNIIDSNYPEEGIKDFMNAPAAYYSAKKWLDLVVQFIDWLKENEIYDNTMIVLISDHGNSFYDDDASESFLSQDRIDPKVSRRCQALFLVKSFNAKEDLQIKSDLLFTADIYSYFYKNGIVKEAKDGFFYNQDTSPRYFSQVLETSTRYLEQDSTPLRTYAISGPLSEVESWEEYK